MEGKLLHKKLNIIFSIPLYKGKLFLRKLLMTSQRNRLENNGSLDLNTTSKKYRSYVHKYIIYCDLMYI